MSILKNNQKSKALSQKEELENKYKSSLSNLLLVMAFTAINIVLLVTNADTYFLFSAFIPYLCVDTGMYLCGMYPQEYYVGDEVFLDKSFFAVMIAVAIVFWMISYIVSNINVLVFRYRLPKAPRTFKVPFGPVIPVIAIIGNMFMIWNIDSDPGTRNLIFMIDGFIFIILAIYSAVWCKLRLKKPMFKPIPMHEVMAMENEVYLIAHQQDREK